MYAFDTRQTTEGTYVINNRFEKQKRRTTSIILLSELNYARKQPTINAPLGFIMRKNGATPSIINGIESISGKYKRIIVNLKDELDLELLKTVADQSSQFYHQQDTVVGWPVNQIRRAGTWYSALFPLVIADELENGSREIEIRKNIPAVYNATILLGRYLEKKYGVFSIDEEQVPQIKGKRVEIQSVSDTVRLQ